MEDIYRKVAELQESNQEGVLVTVVDREGSSPALMGNKMLVYANGDLIGTVGGGNLEYLAVKKAKKVLQNGSNALEHYNLSGEDEQGKSTGMACGGKVSLFFEAFVRRQEVCILGAGHIGKALVKLLEPLHVKLRIVDDRSDMLAAISGRAETIHMPFAEFIETTDFGNKPFFLIATYQHQHDSLILKKLFERNIETPYIGVVASMSTRKLLVEQLKNEMDEPPDLSSVFMPVGLDIGGTDDPWEIALSIVAEMQAVRYGKAVPHIRDKKRKHVGGNDA